MQRVREILIAGAILTALALTAHGQNIDTPDESFTPVSHDTYNRVLDILFPRHETAKNYLLVLRLFTTPTMMSTWATAHTRTKTERTVQRLMSAAGYQVRMTLNTGVVEPDKSAELDPFLTDAKLPALLIEP